MTLNMNFSSEDRSEFQHDCDHTFDDSTHNVDLRRVIVSMNCTEQRLRAKAVAELILRSGQFKALASHSLYCKMKTMYSYLF